MGQEEGREMSERGTSVRQVVLSQGASQLITWLDADPRVKIGRFVTLKDGPPGEWKVVHVYTKTVRERGSIKRDWRVGGLS